MTDTSKNEIERAAAALADGKQLDWERLNRSGELSANELAALRVLEDVQLTGPSEQPLENGFDLRGELGHGSMGRVYRAFDRSLRREVALKIVSQSPGAKASSRASFLAEARTLAQVRHPAIVQVFSVHEHEGEIRLALELIEGRTLERVVDKDGPLSPAEAARVGSELCRALAALHERGITHRDLKPANVMREHGGRIVLLDFGIARSPDSSVPLASGAAGTPRFMAPEQFNGGAVGPQADLWALGVLLYWLVSARFPFEGATFGALALSVLNGRAVSLLDRRADIDPRFARALARALERDLRDRYRTAGEFEQELRALVVEGDPAGHGSKSRERPAPALPPRRGWMGPMLALVSLALVAALWLHFQGGPAVLRFDAELYARRGGQDVRLQNGDVITSGELLVLEASSPEPVHVYVINVDDAGEEHVLFPVPGYEPENPLPAGAVQRLPGSLEGVPHYWKVTSGGGGGEGLFIVAAREPIPVMEELLALIPPVRAGEEPTYPELPVHTRTAFLRGIGGTAADKELSTAAEASRRTHGLDLLELAAELDPASGYAVRVLRLQNR